MFAVMPRTPRPRRPVPPSPPGAVPAGAPAHYASAYHAPVMVREVAEWLISDPDGAYVDGTLGGGGHSAALLDALRGGARVIGIDRDEEAINEASRRLSVDSRFRAIRGAFGDMDRLLAGAGAVDGVLLDLGISSHQVDESARGFAFSAEGPLDMRMDRDAPASAAGIVNETAPGELASLLFAFGEEPRARGIARAIAAARPLETTVELAEVVRRSVPGREEKKSLARVFQALRIAVNDELGELERALRAATRLVRPGGRLAVLSYHSLEDRRAKRFLRAGDLSGTVPRDGFGRPVSPWRPLVRHSIEASPEEVAANPRARSARLRVAERTEHPISPDPRDGGQRGGAGPDR